MLFPWYTKYPYQNDEVLNLDWVLKTIDNLVKEVADFVTLNTIKYADPIQWNITTQYEKNTVVIDPISGSAYISVQPVPSGVGLNNTDYWDIIFTLDVISANKNITLRDDANNMLATFESAIGDWVLWQGTLYVVTRAIEIGQAYVEDYNIERATVEYFLKLYIENLKTYIVTLIGSLDDLETVDKNSIVAAINEVLSTLKATTGSLDDLDTTVKTDIVAAINEVLSSLVVTTGSLDDLDTTIKTNLVAAINEVVDNISTINTNIGNMDSLDTSATNLVEAINEVLASSNVIKPEEFGAEGDGVTDDTVAFKACVNASRNNDKAILLTGNYLLSDIVNLYSGIKILGDGATITINYNPGSGTSTDNCLFKLTNCSNVLIYGITFNDNNHASTSTLSRYCIIGGTNASDIEIAKCKFYDTGSHHCTLFYASNRINTHHCLIDGYTYGGFSHVETCNDIIVAHCVIKNGKYTGNGNRYAIILCGWDSSGSHRMGNNLQALYNYISDTTGEWEGIDCHGGTHIKVIGNYIENIPESIAIGTARGTSTGDYDSEWVEIANNTIIVDPNNIPNDKFIASIIFGGRFGDIHDNYVFTNASVDIMTRTIFNMTLVDCQYTQIHNNSFMNPAIRGIDIVSSFRNTASLYIHDNSFIQLSSAIQFILCFVRGGAYNYTGIHLFNNIVDGATRLADGGTISGTLQLFFDNNVYYEITNYDYGTVQALTYGDVATNSNISTLKGIVGKHVRNASPAVGVPYEWVYAAGNWHSLGNLT